MVVSLEKIAANKANAQHSTGPRTEAGKLAARRNAIKHGLTGAGLALPDEDANEIQRMIENLYEQMQPKTEAGAALVAQIALSRLRLARFALAETAMASDRILNAGYNFDDAQVARRDEAKAKLYEDPETQLAVLARFEAGSKWVVNGWESLANALESCKPGDWKQPQFDLFEALSGRSTEFPSDFDSTTWNLAAMGDNQALADPGLHGETPAARWKSARGNLLAVAKGEVARWRENLESAKVTTARAREYAIQAARYDGSKDGLLAKRYEAATTRALNKATKDFKRVEAEFAEPEPEPIVETPEPAEPCVEVGSFSHEPEPDAAGPDVVPIPVIEAFQAPLSDPIDPVPTLVLNRESDESRLL